MAREIRKKDKPAPETTVGVKRRGLLRFGTLVTAFTGASAISALGANSAHAGPGDKNPSTDYVPIAQKGTASGVATLDLGSKIPTVQLPDLSGIYAGVPKNLKNGLTGWFHVDGFGAVLNGTTDDSTAINDAIAAASAAGGGVVYIPSGVAGIGSSLTLASNVSIRGNGRSLTTLKALASLTTAVILGSSGATVSKSATTDLTIDASYATTGNTIAGLQITNGDSPTVRNVRVTNAGGPGVLFQGLGTGGGTPNARVEACDFDGIGLVNGTTGHAIWFKDNSPNAQAINNTGRNIVGGMGIGLSGSAGTGYPTRAQITGNIITMSPSTAGFEPIGITAGCTNAIISNNTVYDSQDNGISVSADFCTVIGNNVDGALNHGIASSGKGTSIIGNYIRNVGKQGALAYGGISLAGASKNVITGNRIVDDQANKTMSHGIKFVTSAGGNLVGINSIEGASVSTYGSPAVSDIIMDGNAFADGFSLGKVYISKIFGTDTGSSLLIQTSAQCNSQFYVGSAGGGPAQFNVISNAVNRAAAAFIAAPGQTADLIEGVASDKTTVLAGMTKTGRIYSNDGLTSKDLGDVTGKTSAQIDALFTAAPTDGTVATGLLSAAPVFLCRRNGKWNSSAASVIA